MNRSFRDKIRKVDAENRTPFSKDLKRNNLIVL